MKFLHTADWHIGTTRYLHQFLERQEQAINSIFQIATDYDVSGIVIAGDLFHQKIHPQSEKDMLFKKILQFNKSGKFIIMISGNHDLLAPGLTHLRYLTIHTERDRIDNLVVEDKRIRLYQFEDTIFILIPNGAVAAEDFNAVVADRLEKIKNSSISLDYKNIVVVAHEAVQGANSDVYEHNGNPIYIPKGLKIKLRKDITYWALGDLHLRQRIGRRCYYSGAPIQTRWGEAPDKGVLIVDTETPDKPEFVPVETKKMITYTEVPSIWPENEHQRLLATGEIPDNLPKSVFVVVPVHVKKELGESVETKIRESVSVLEGLPEFLDSIDCPPESKTVALAEAAKIVKDLGLE